MTQAYEKQRPGHVCLHLWASIYSCLSYPSYVGFCLLPLPGTALATPSISALECDRYPVIRLGS